MTKHDRIEIDLSLCGEEDLRERERRLWRMIWFGITSAAFGATTLIAVLLRWIGID